MRDKIVFFILGALLATLAYFAGDLEPLTAEDKFIELEKLRVNSLMVKDSILVGDIGKKFILMRCDNEFAQIDLHGAELSENPDGLSNNVGDAPAISLVGGGDSALIKVLSHNKRPKAKSILGVLSREGKYESALIIQDLNGTNSVFSD